MGWDFNNLEFINFEKFFSLSHGSTGHTRKLGIHSEKILESDRCQSLAFLLNFYIFFGFDCLMQTITVSTSKHQTPGKFINNDNFAVTDDIVTIALKQSFGTQSLFDMMNVANSGLLVNICQAEQLFQVADTLFR